MKRIGRQQGDKKKEQVNIPMLEIAYQINEVVYTPTPENELQEIFTSIMDNFDF